MSEAMPPTGEKKERWLTSLQAVKKFQLAGGIDRMALAHWAEEGSLRTRAGRCYVNGEETEFTGWPDIPSDFWRWVYADWDGCRHYVNWEAGVFGALVQYEPDIDMRDSGSDYWKLHGVTFNRADLEGILDASSDSPIPSHPSSNSVSNSRGAGKKPNKLRWEKTAAAMAVLAARKDFDPDQSQNAWQEKIATFLMERGHEDAFEVDSLRDMFERYKRWSANEPYDDDSAD